MGYIHLKDSGNGKTKEWNLPALGEGVTDFVKIFKMLEKFDGPASVEIEFDGPDSSLEEINEAVKKSYIFLEKHNCL